MGLLAEIDVQRWGFPLATSIKHIQVDYSGVGELYTSIAVPMAQGACPVRTGRLRSSISGSGGGTKGTVQTTTEYAQYVEYGTWKMMAQPYFTAAVEAGAAEAYALAQQRYQEALEEEMRQIIEEMRREMDRMMRSMRSSFGGGSRRSRARGSVYENSHTSGGITWINRGGKAVLKKGLNYMMTKSSMWRKGTSFYNVAVSRSNNLNASRAAAQRTFDTGSPTGSSSRSSSRGGGGGGGYSGGGGSRSYSRSSGSSRSSSGGSMGSGSGLVEVIII